MLRLSVRDEEFLMIGDDVKIIFLFTIGATSIILRTADSEEE